MADTKLANENDIVTITNGSQIYIEKETVPGNGIWQPFKGSFTEIKTWINSQIPSVSNPFLTPQQFSNNEIIADGTQVTATDAGYDQAEANAAWPLTAAYFGGDVPLDAYLDFLAVSECILSTEDAAFQNEIYYGAYGGNEYSINYDLPAQKLTDKISHTFIHNYGGCTMRAYNGANIISSMPADQTEADAIVARSLLFVNGTFYGSDNPGDNSIGIELGACVYACFSNMNISRFDFGWDLSYCLFSSFENCTGVGCATDNWFLHAGAWSGASASNSQCNDSDFWNCRSIGALGSNAGFNLQDSSDINLIGCTCEGQTNSGDLANQPAHGIYFNDNNSTVVKGLNIDGLHAEQSYTIAVIHTRGREGTYNYKDIYNQVQGLYVGANTDLLYCRTNAGVMKHNIINLLYATANLTINNLDGYQHYNFSACEFPDGAATPYQASISTIWGASTPPLLNVITLVNPNTQFNYVQLQSASSSGDSITVTIEKTALIMKMSGTFATLTVNLPDGAYDGQPLDLIFDHAVVALTMGGTAITRSIGNPIAGQMFHLVYSSALDKWAY